MLENSTDKKTAVILFNLGGPDKLESVKPFLFNLFYDPAIIKLPNPWRWLVAKLISKLREPKAQKIYSLIGGKSSLLEETRIQKLAISNRLKKISKSNFEIFISMRYWYPRIDEVLKQLKEYEPHEIILMPLYPQFSTTTTGSSLKEFNEIKAKFSKINSVPVKTICCYYKNNSFIEAHSSLINKAIKEMNSSNYRVLFSAHGLPRKIILEGDPYQWQVQQTVENVVNNLGIDGLDYKLTYQSRATPVEWLTPDTEKEIEIACKQGKSLIIVPIAFVSEHVETLVELDIEYKAIADRSGVSYIRVPALGTDDTFIDSISKMIIDFSNSNNGIICNSEKLRCPKNLIACPYEKIADWYDQHQSRDLFEKAWIDKAIALLPKDSQVLDLGCGTGEAMMLDFSEKEYGVTGVDSSEKLIAIAKARHPKLEFIISDMRGLNLNRKFDLVVAWNSFFYLSQDDQRTMFKTFASHLKVGGVLLFTTGPKAGEAWSDNGGKNLYYASLSPDEYKVLLQQHGFMLIEHKISEPECGEATIWLTKLKQTIRRIV